MYDVTRKGHIQVFKVAADGAETFVSRHVDEAEAIGAANTHGERSGGGRYRLAYPDKVVRVIIQGPAPSPPVITVFTVSGSSTELDIELTVPAVGVAPPFTYELQESDSGPGGPFVAIPSSFTGTPLRYRRRGLASGLTRHYQVRALDSAVPQQASAWSNVAGASVPVPAQSTWWPNWPTMNGAAHQGNSSTHILDTARHAELADKDALIIQSFNATESRKVSRVTALAQIRAQNPGNRVKVLLYFILQETTKVLFTPAGNDPLEVSCALIADPVKGNPNWIVHRVNQTGDAGRVECNFDPVNRWNCNMAVLVAGNNSLGENYATAHWKDWYVALSTGTDFVPSIDGVFQDNFNARPPNMFQSNGGVSVTDQDYSGNGVADARADFSASVNAGGRLWSEGHLECKAQFEARFGDAMVLCPNAARLYSDYTDGLGSPPLPITLHPYYQKFELTLQESVQLFLGLAKSSTAYSFNNTGSVSSFFRMYNVQERMLKPDAQNTRTGKSAVMIHALCVNRAVPTNDDYVYARFICALCMLVERAAMCVMQDAALPLSLDETLLELGPPQATRTMGVLNESNVTFSMRTADQSVGVARFYWSIFEKGMVLVRTDAPAIGAYPSADAAVTCTLPSPGVGKKWQRINAATYVNQRTDRAMRGQDLAVNSGADVTTVALKPFHAIFLRLV